MRGKVCKIYRKVARMLYQGQKEPEFSEKQIYKSLKRKHKK